MCYQPLLASGRFDDERAHFAASVLQLVFACRSSRPLSSCRNSELIVGSVLRKKAWWARQRAGKVLVEAVLQFLYKPHGAMHKLSMRQLGLVRDDDEQSPKPLPLQVPETWQPVGTDLNGASWFTLNFVPLAELNRLHLEQLVRQDRLDSQLLSAIRAHMERYE